MVKNLVQLSLLKQTKTLQIRAAEPKMWDAAHSTGITGITGNCHFLSF
jgi:hypothetical protein